jgi:hypothetical protein
LKTPTSRRPSLSSPSTTSSISWPILQTAIPKR